MNSHGTIRAIFISKKRDGVIETPERVECEAGKGIVGDRYFHDHLRRSPDYQVTLIETEQIQAFCDHAQSEIEPWEPRRNVLTQGVDLNALVGSTFRMGSAVLEGVELCEPCKILEKRIGHNAKEWFKGRGGLRAKVIASGAFQVGDALVSEESHSGKQKDQE